MRLTCPYLWLLFSQLPMLPHAPNLSSEDFPVVHAGLGIGASRNVFNISCCLNRTFDVACILKCTLESGPE